MPAAAAHTRTVMVVFPALKPIGGYLFLRGESTRLDTCTDLWRRQLAHVFKHAGISNGHPHRFRDTFAVELLQSGVPFGAWQE